MHWHPLQRGATNNVLKDGPHPTASGEASQPRASMEHNAVKH